MGQMNRQAVKFIYYKWGSVADDILIPKLKDAGYDPVIIEKKCENYTRDMVLAQEFIFKINQTGAGFVFSYDYFPILSIVCDTCKIPYFSWVYDSPHLTLNAASAGLECNHIGVFDRALVKKYEAKGIKTIFHLPLGGSPAFFQESISSCKRDYACDISFVGSLYTDEHEYYGLLKSENPADDSGIWDRLDALVLNQAFDYENDCISDVLTAGGGALTDYLYKLMEKKGLTLGGDYITDKQDIVSDEILSKRVTVTERKELLEKVAVFSSENGFDFRLYTGSEPAKGSILSKGPVLNDPIDYLTQMPSVFCDSRINLNITLRSIKTGIPLRAVDILCCGGFLMTDPREEFFEYLVEGEDFEVYRSVDECLEKVKFYLSHEELRKKIAKNGRAKAEKAFNLGRLTDILPK